jgi:hypothetical protein
MANINLYATLAEYKAYSTARGQTASTDATDDGAVVDLLEAASRYLDNKTRRQFFPTIETRLYDIPNDSILLLEQDLLAVITLTNGDATTITTANYNLMPANTSPYYAIRLNDISTVAWEANSSGSGQQVISVNAWWGYREQYAQRAWQLAGTLGAAITDTTTLAFTMTAGHTLTAGQIIKIGSEIYNISTVSTNTITPIARGDNGSTAATHINGTSVYTWKPQEDARAAVLEIANTAYQRRFGKSTDASAQVTAAGVVLTPRDIPRMAEEFIAIYRRWV